MRRFMEHPATPHAGRGVLLMLAGAVMGAAVGFLTAPQSGERTRRHVVRGAEDAKAYVADLCEDVTDKIGDLRRGVAGTCAVGKKYLEKTKRGLLGGPREYQNRFRRLIHTLRV